MALILSKYLLVRHSDSYSTNKYLLPSVLKVNRLVVCLLLISFSLPRLPVCIDLRIQRVCYCVIITTKLDSAWDRQYGLTVFVSFSVSSVGNCDLISVTVGHLCPSLHYCLLVDFHFSSSAVHTEPHEQTDVHRGLYGTTGLYACHGYWSWQCSTALIQIFPDIYIIACFALLFLFS